MILGPMNKLKDLLMSIRGDSQIKEFVNKLTCENDLVKK